MSTARRTQAERSAATQSVLIDAAIDSLVEHGWAATTSVAVCARAGVTRGAFVHHFPSLPALMAASLQALYDDMLAEAPPAPATLVDVIDATWRCVGSPRFKAVIEAWLAMANDPDLADDLSPVVLRFAELVSPATFAPTILRDAERKAHFAMAREAMLGLALGRAANGGRALPHETAVLATLRERAAELDRR